MVSESSGHWQKSDQFSSISSNESNELSCEYFRLNTSLCKDKLLKDALIDTDKSDTLCNRNLKKRNDKCSKEKRKNDKCLVDRVSNGVERRKRNVDLKMNDFNAKACSNDLNSLNDECLRVTNNKCLEDNNLKHRTNSSNNLEQRLNEDKLNGEQQIDEFKEQKQMNKDKREQLNDTLMKLDKKVNALKESNSSCIKELKTDQNQLDTFINSNRRNDIDNDLNNVDDEDKKIKNIKSKINSKNTSSIAKRFNNKQLNENAMYRANSVGENINETEFKLNNKEVKLIKNIKRSFSETVLHFNDYYDVNADDELEEDDDYEEKDEEEDKRLDLSNNKINNLNNNKSNVISPTKSTTNDSSISSNLSTNLSFNNQNSSYCLDTYSFKNERLQAFKKMPDQSLDFFSSDEQSLVEQTSKQNLINELAINQNRPMLDLDTQTEDQISEEDVVNNQIDLQDLKERIEKDVLDQTDEYRTSEYKTGDDQTHQLTQFSNEISSDIEEDSIEEVPFNKNENYYNLYHQKNSEKNFQSTEFENELFNHEHIQQQQQRYHLTSLENLFSLETIEEQDEDDYSLKDQSLRSNLSQQQNMLEKSNTKSSNEFEHDATNDDISNIELLSIDESNIENATRSSRELNSQLSPIVNNNSQMIMQSTLSQINSTRELQSTEELINNIYKKVCFEEDSLNGDEMMLTSENTSDYKKYKTFKRDISLEEEEDQTLSNELNDCEMNSSQENEKEIEHFNSLSECTIDENVTIDDQQVVVVKKSKNIKPNKTNNPDKAKQTKSTNKLNQTKLNSIISKSSKLNRSNESKKMPLIKPEICKRSSLINKNIEQLDKSKKKINDMLQINKIEPRARITSDLILNKNAVKNVKPILSLNAKSKFSYKERVK